MQSTYGSNKFQLQDLQDFEYRLEECQTYRLTVSASLVLGNNDLVIPATDSKEFDMVHITESRPPESVTIRPEAAEKKH